MADPGFIPSLDFDNTLSARNRRGLQTFARTVLGQVQTYGIRVRIRCTVSGGVVSVVAANNIAIVQRISAGTYVITALPPYASDTTFNAFASATFDMFQQISRTNQSVTVQTASGRDAAAFDVTLDLVNLYDAGTGSIIVLGAWVMAFGQIDLNNVGGAGFNPASPSSGVVLPTGFLILSLTYAPVLAYADTGASNNVIAITFTYQTETNPNGGGGGVALGVRWSQSNQSGVLAFINSFSALVEVAEMVNTGIGIGWTTVQTTTTGLTLTPGNSYTLTLTDTGTTVTASITDDGGPKTAAITTSRGTANTQIVYGWVTLQGFGGGFFTYSFGSTISSVPTV